MTENSYISEIDESAFEEKVIKESASALVLVDFWAPWCGPCKQLTPTLEKITNDSKGKIRLVKIDIDKNQQIASQMRIQSIPAVFAFKDGKPVNGFQGVIPEKKIIEFIEKCIGEKIKEDNSSFYKLIEDMIKEKKFEEAKNEIELFLSDNNGDPKVMAMYIECLGYMEKYIDAENFYKSLDKDILSDDSVKASIQKLNIKKKNSVGPSLEDIIIEFNEKPENIKVLIKLADKYFAQNMIDESFELLLLNYNKNKVEIKAKLLEFFEALGNNNDKTIFYRKKLSSMIFS